jgi:phosphatidylglycerol:prolipoprotein diacylglycerol transferase
LYPRLVQFGHLAIPTYGVLVAIALIAGLASLLQFARRLGLDANKLWNLGLIAILTTLLSARLLVVGVYFSAFREHPFWVLGLAATRTATWVEAGAVVLGFAAALLYALAEGLPLLRVLDCAAPSAALGLAIGSVGAFLSGSGYGLPASGGWSVTYTSAFSAIWYGTPLGIPLYPVQLYEAVVWLAILAALLWRLPRRAQDGELAGAWLLFGGLAGFFLSFYRGAGEEHFWFRQAAFSAMVIAGGGLLLGRKERIGAADGGQGNYTGVNDPQQP